MAEASVKSKKSGNRIVKFFKETKSELKKVVWPSKQQIIKNTLIVIAAVIAIGAVIWILDFLFQLGLGQIIGK